MQSNSWTSEHELLTNKAPATLDYFISKQDAWPKLSVTIPVHEIYSGQDSALIVQKPQCRNGGFHHGMMLTVSLLAAYNHSLVPMHECQLLISLESVL